VERWTIYCHTHVESGRRYIGLTSRTMERRWSDHCYAAKRNAKGGRWHFPNAIRKYGPEAFSHEIIRVFDNLEDANIAEESLIKRWKTRDPKFGFNVSKGGLHIPHPIKRNPWDQPGFREKVLASIKIWYENPFNRAYKSSISKKVLSRPEVRNKLSKATSEQFSSKESRIRMSETIRELHRDPHISLKFRKGLETANKNRSSRTHCKNGHEFTHESTRINDNGWRFCRRCAADRSSEYDRNARTKCSKGHDLSDSNVYLSSDGRRLCIICKPTVCFRGHQLSDKPKTFNERGCYRCKLERARVYDATRRLKRKCQSL